MQQAKPLSPAPVLTGFAAQVKSTPVALDPDALKLVSGGAPKGGWIEAAAACAPKGGW